MNKSSGERMPQVKAKWRALVPTLVLLAAAHAHAAPEALPRHGVVMFSNLCVGERSGDLHGLRITLRRIGDVDDLMFELENEPPQRIWPVRVEGDKLSFTIPKPYSGAAVVARLLRHGETLQLDGPVVNADSKDQIELRRITNFARGLPNC
ncbi:hypothetical protein ACG04R_06230 [Roseateles sp. BYS78W]|uniref:Uncharacterized protein n=1 Tax=Pelomonas candidula TaxID=3299025 RepID=A0ABW7H8N3_9BURK